MPSANAEDYLKVARAALTQDAHLNTRLDQQTRAVKLHLEADMLVLQGEVEDIVLKRRAALAVSEAVAVAGITVIDHLNVRPMEVLGDEAVRVTVLRNLQEEGGLLRCSLWIGGNDADAGPVREQTDESRGRISVSVQDGVVVLEGYVQSLTERRLAEVNTWWAQGCRRVDNQLQVIPPEQDNDDELNDAVLMTLEKSPLVHAEQLQVATRHGIVKLRGVVNNATQKDIVVMTPWYVPGVKGVEDQLQVMDNSP